MPLDRALGGRKERNSRAVLALGEKGLKTVETSVMNRVIILKQRPGRRLAMVFFTRSIAYPIGDNCKFWWKDGLRFELF